MSKDIKKTKLWINVTSSYHWRNHHPVGIIRVELETIKYFLNCTEFEMHYYYYDKKSDDFIELTEKIVKKEIINRKTLKVSTDENVILTRNQLIKRKYKAFIRIMPNRSQPILISFGNLLRKIYRNIYLVPKYHFINKYGHLNAIFTNTNRKNHEFGVSKRAEEIFDENCILLSLGLDWDFLNIRNHYKIKERTRCKLAFFCYDVIPVKFPHLTLEDVAQHFTHYFVDIAWSADHIFCISKNSERDLKNYLNDVGAPIPNTSVVKLGDKVPKTDIKGSIRLKELIGEKKFILFVSTIERRKNHETVYKAYRSLLEKGNKELPLLLFAGMPGWGINDFMEDLRRDPLIKDKIYLLQDVSDDELCWLYLNCLFTVFPSIYEGWGLPIAESLSYGKYCLAANNSAITEVGENYVEYVETFDVSKWAEKIAFYSSNLQSLKQKEDFIKLNYRPSNWRDFGKQVNNKLKQL